MRSATTFPMQAHQSAPRARESNRVHLSCATEYHGFFLCLQRFHKLGAMTEQAVLQVDACQRCEKLAHVGCAHRQGHHSCPKLRRDGPSPSSGTARAQESYMEDGLRLLELARDASQPSAIQAAKREKTAPELVLSNCEWDRGEVSANFRQPFDLLAESAAAAVSSDAARANCPQGIQFGWGTWIRTRTNGVRVRGSTVNLFPSRRVLVTREAGGCAPRALPCSRHQKIVKPAAEFNRSLFDRAPPRGRRGSLSSRRGCIASVRRTAPRKARSRAE